MTSSSPRLITIPDLQAMLGADQPPEKWIRQRSRELRLGKTHGRHFLVFPKFAEVCREEFQLTAGELRRLAKSENHCTREGLIYFVKCMHLVKIGFAINVERRFRSLKTISPFDMELLGSIEGTITGERAIQVRLKAYHHRGEWFRYDPILRKLIKELCKCP